MTLANGAAPFGQIFINGVRMIVIPLVVTIIFASIARLGDIRALGRIGGQTLAFYGLSLIPAILIGMGIMAIGLRFVPDLTMPAADAVTVPQLRGLTEFFVGLVPSNIFASAAKGAILPLIVFTALFAAAAGTLEKARRDRMVQGAEDISAALIKLVWWILYLAPIGVFGLIAPARCSDNGPGPRGCRHSRCGARPYLRGGPHTGYVPQQRECDRTGGSCRLGG